MGEAKRKREEAERKKSAEMGKGLLSLILTFLAISIIALPVLLVWYVLEKPKASSRFTESKSVAPSEPTPQPRATPQRVVIDTAEGFIAEAKRLSAMRNPLDLEQALVLWRGAVHKDPQNAEALRGYATTLVQVLLHKDRTQPARPLPADLLQEARSASYKLLMREAGTPLAHELSAYCEAFSGNLQAAQMQLSQGDLVRGGPAITPGGMDMMTEIIMISNRRQNGMHQFQPMVPVPRSFPHQR